MICCWERQDSTLELNSTINSPVRCIIINNFHFQRFYYWCTLSAESELLLFYLQRHHFEIKAGADTKCPVPPHSSVWLQCSPSHAIYHGCQSEYCCAKHGLCWEAQKREQRYIAFIDPNLRQSQGQMGCCSMRKLIFLSNRRPRRGIAIVARSEEEWTVDSSEFPLLHYVSDMNNSSLRNRKKSDWLHQIRLLNISIWVLAANIWLTWMISDMDMLTL